MKIRSVLAFLAILAVTLCLSPPAMASPVHWDCYWSNADASSGHDVAYFEFDGGDPDDFSLRATVSTLNHIEKVYNDGRAYTLVERVWVSAGVNSSAWEPDIILVE